LQLLELLMDAGKEIAGVTEILTGQQPTQNSPANSVLALIKQGLVQYNAVYKRVLRSFKKEFLLLYYLNSKNLDLSKYIAMSDDPEASADDFKTLDIDIRPVADPNMSSETQRLAKAQAIYGLQEVDRDAAVEYLLEAMDIQEEEILKLLPQLAPHAPPKDPPPKDQKDLAQAEFFKAQAEAIEISLKGDAAKLEVGMQKDQADLMLKTHKTASDIALQQSQEILNRGLAVKAMADADSSASDAHKTKKEIDYVGKDTSKKN
jgi:hypothetical protein